jgi:hypothetical protein
MHVHVAVVTFFGASTQTKGGASSPNQRHTVLLRSHPLETDVVRVVGQVSMSNFNFTDKAGQTVSDAVLLARDYSNAQST